VRWELKVAVQFVLSRAPLGERINHLLQRIRRDRSDRRRYMSEQLPELCEALRQLDELVTLRNARVVEVGTGWCPLPTVLLHLCGVQTIYTYDHVRHLRFDLTQEMIELLAEMAEDLGRMLNRPVEALRNQLSALRSCSDLDQLLRAANIEYIAPGDATSTSLPTASIDVFYSYAVLEHVSEDVARRLFSEARRVLKDSGIFYALIGLHDHYACVDSRISKVNFLKYPEWMWRLLVKNRISYHNRLRQRDFIEMMREEAGLLRKINSVMDPQDLQRVRDMKVAERFRRYSPEECAVTQCELFVSFAERP